MVQLLCDSCVVLGIHVPKVHTFTVLFVLSVEMAHKTKGGKANRNRKDLQPESEKKSVNC